jgi:very-short-patch-repair endonuclease
MTKDSTTSTRFRWAASDRYALLKDFAKQNRKNATLAESRLWEQIRNKNLGVEFRRQHIIADFIADFVCLDRMLIIEIDGGYHSERKQIEDDEIRTERLNRLGFQIIRFTNEKVLFDIKCVLQEILKALRE